MPIAKIVKKVAKETSKKSVYIRMTDKDGALEATYTANREGDEKGLKVQSKVEYKNFEEMTSELAEFLESPVAQPNENE